jgi:hypothetical protein
MTSLAKTTPTATCWTLHDPTPIGFVLAVAAFNIFCFQPREWGPRTLTVVVDTRGDIGFYYGEAGLRRPIGYAQLTWQQENHYGSMW